MHRESKRSSRQLFLTAFACAVTALGLAAATPEQANAYRIGGQAWPKRVITYRVTVANFRQPVTAAIAQWNASGVRLRFREVRAGKADVIVKTLSVPRIPSNAPPEFRCGLAGAAGRGSLGYSRSFQAYVLLDRNCSKRTLVRVAAHEFGHVMGLHHTSVRCAVMTAANTPCADERHYLPWEYTCTVLRPDDIAGAIRRYGGKMRPMPKARTCLRVPTPGPVSGLAVEPDPADSIATSRIAWQTPTSPAVRRIVVRRNQGACPNLPSAPGRFVSIRPNLTPLHGDLVADIPATSGAQSVTDLMPMTPGRTCYAVWAVGPNDVYLDAATVIIDHPGSLTAAARIGLVSEPPPTLEVAARLRWTNPTDQGLSGEVLIVWFPGACPANPQNVPRGFAGTVPSTPGPAAFDHVTSVRPEPRCYAVEFQREGTLATVGAFLIQVG